MCGGAAGRDGASSGVRGGSCRRAALAARRILRSAEAFARRACPEKVFAGGAGRPAGRFGHRSKFFGNVPHGFPAFGHRSSNFKFRYNGFNGYEERLGTDSVF